jgi:hypothetical protein
VSRITPFHGTSIFHAGIGTILLTDFLDYRTIKISDRRFTAMKKIPISNDF